MRTRPDADAAPAEVARWLTEKAELLATIRRSQLDHGDRLGLPQRSNPPVHQ